MIEENYAAIIVQIKAEIETTRLKAAVSVNQYLLILYWKIGSIILRQQNLEGWGTKVIERLSNYLRKYFPDMKGTSARNLKYMRAFAEAYPEFVQQPTAQIVENAIMQVPLAQLNEFEFVQVSLAQITWYHHITIIDKLKDVEERIFYINKTSANNWSRNVLVHQIESGLYHRQGKAVSNFVQTLPASKATLPKKC